LCNRLANRHGALYASAANQGIQMLRRQLLVAMGGTLASAIWAPVQAADESFALTSIALYLPEQALEERGPSAAVLSAYIEALIAQAKTALAAAPKQRGVSGSIVVGLKPPAQSRVWIMASNAGAQTALTALLKASLEATSPPAVKNWNAFALNFNAWGGGPAVASTLPVPDEWRRALDAQGGGMLPDSALSAIWPN